MGRRRGARSETGQRSGATLSNTRCAKRDLYCTQERGEERELEGKHGAQSEACTTTRGERGGSESEESTVREAKPAVRTSAVTTRGERGGRGGERRAEPEQPGSERARRADRGKNRNSRRRERSKGARPCTRGAIRMTREPRRDERARADPRDGQGLRRDWTEIAWTMSSSVAASEAERKSTLLN